jgi:two-component system LytT family response regulator
MEPVRALVVDDEKPGRERLRRLLVRDGRVELAGSCAGGAEAIEQVRAAAAKGHPIHLLFLDVQMPELDGFGVAATLVAEMDAELVPAVIFVTAHDEYALRAFDAHAVDYLLKPFDDERFERAVSRAREQIQGRRRAEAGDRLGSLLDELRARNRFIERLVVRSGGRILILRVELIDWIEAASNYVRIHAAGKEFLLRETMTSLESKLDPNDFVRIHRSTIVRVDRIRELEPLFQGDYVVILEDNTRLTSSRGYREKLQELLQGSR